MSMLQARITLQLVAEASKFIDLPSVNDIVFVDTTFGCQRAGAWLQGQHMLGVDAEWRPSLNRDEQTAPAILQVMPRRLV